MSSLDPSMSQSQRRFPALVSGAKRDRLHVGSRLPLTGKDDGDNALAEILTDPSVGSPARTVNPAANTLAYSSNILRCRNELPISRNTAHRTTT
jgi:hypothetical protein